MDALDQKEFLLPRFSLRRRITVLVLLATLLVVGMIATLDIPLELIPRGYESPSLTVWATWSDAPSQEVLDKLTQPLEEELSTVPGLSDVFSFATTGFTRCTLTFKLGTDMDVAYREVRDRVERAKARMPDEIDRVQIRKQDDASIPVYAVGLAVDPELTDAYDLIQNEIIKPIERIDGVASIEAHGLEQKEVLIELDRKKTAASGLNVFALSAELANDNFSLASGHVRTGDKKLLLRSVAKYPDLEALENRPVAPNVRLADVATVRYEEPEKKYRARVSGKPAVAVIVFKEGEANALRVSAAVDAAVEKMKTNPRLELIEMSTFLNQGEIILESLTTLLSSGRSGALLAMLVLFFFLRRFRMTLIITLAIPLSLLMGMTAMYFFGETLNIISLLGLMISVGMLVDNSIVVGENILRLYQEGLGRFDACVRGAGEISLAIVLATLTTVVVFLPVSLVEGQGQFFLLRLAIPITASLLASLLVALVFVPLAVYLTLSAQNGAERRAHHHVGEALRRALRRAYAATLEPVNHGYTRLLGFFLDRRMDLVLAVALIAVITGTITKKVELVQVQDEERGFFEINVVLPQATTLEEAEEYFLAVEKMIEAHKEELDLEGYLIFHRANGGEIQGWFNNPRTNELSPRTAIENVLAWLPERAGVELYTGLESDDEKESQAVHVVTLYGEDAAQLERLARDLERVFTTVDGVVGLKSSGDLPAEELALVVDRDRAQHLDVDPEVIAGVVRSSLGGRALPKFYRDGREIPVRVRFREEDRESLAELADFRVPAGGMTGRTSVSLASVTDTRRLEAPQRIFRRNKQIARTLTLELEDGKETAARQAIRRLSAAIDLPEGVSFGVSNRRSGLDEETRSMLFAIGLSVVFIYLLMGFLFESFILPLSIVVTIPLAMIGVYWAHYLTGYHLDSLGLVGVVLLIGVVVNNGIVLVDAVNRRREEGDSRREALLWGAHHRFRPIMMTALTTIIGMVPFTFGGTTSIGLSYTSFGLTLIGGMTTATFLTLLVVPLAYTFFDDLRAKVSTALRRALAPRPSRPAGARPI